ncbi:MAG: endonuclease [Clostridiales bacterium]|nr:endonuclease [Clostridiales bacterium]
MTKGRKIGISLAFALIFLFVCMCVFPLYTSDNANVASASVATISAASTWDNPYNGTYYKNLNTNQTGSSFYDDLAALITNTHKTQISYDDLKSKYKITDVDPNVSGNVIWFYTGDSIPYTGAMDSGNYPTNREHVWPKMGGAAFPEKSQAGSDAHHVRPLNTGLNNTRSNNHFGEVPKTTANRVYQSGTYSNYGTDDLDSWCYQATVSGVKYFYPAAGYRGATARILFYVQTRWGKTSDLSFTLGSGSAKVMSNVDILLKWHLQEPPTEEEIRRNSLVETVQGNRNPFIDHPEFAEMIYCNDGNSYNNSLKNVVAQYGSYLNDNGGGDTPTLTGLTLSHSSLSLEVGQSSTVTVTAVPSTASNSVTWSTSNSSVATVTNGTVKAVKAGTATITATSTVNTNIKASLTVTVAEQELPPTLTGITLSHSSLTLAVGATQTVTVTATPMGADNSVNWSTSNSAVATVTNGVVRAVGKGNATITATSRENSSIKATLSVTVVEESDMEGIFNEKMQALNNANTLQERYEAIAEAISAYNQMSQSDKAAHAADKATLDQAIAAYNEEVGKINQEFQEATNVASQAIAKAVSMSFLALVLIVIKRTVGR